jgi:DNA-binding CsgD family transcriptional regulator
MTNLEKMVQISLRNSDKIKGLCAPLYQQFPLRHFWCSIRTLEDGRFLCLGSNPALHETYYHLKSYLHNPTFRNPSLIQSGFYFHQNYKEDEYRKTINQYMANFDAEFCAVSLVKTKKEIITWGYAVQPASTHQFNGMLVNNIPLFQQFNKYFMKEARDLFIKNRDDYIDVANELGDYYNKESPFVSFCKKERGRFLNSLGVLDFGRLNKLSTQERRCLKRVAEAMPASQIALSLGLSVRTVEHYLDSLKNKLQCESKLQLFQYASLLKSCGFFAL